jgi:hypothetical protein
MKEDESGVRITREERARLRISVDVPALERLLSATPSTDRYVTFVHFVRAVTADDIREFHRANGDPVGLAEFERTLAAPGSVPDVLPENQGHTNSLPFVVIPTDNFVLDIEPPREPAMRALWDAVEPGYAP